jgi:O-antigen biosynthesis protein
VRASFIIPLYNCLPLTQAMLASLQATLPAGMEHEIILIDDGSTDGTREWLRTFADKRPFRLLLNERNLGYATTNNRAAEIARGEYLVLLNNDLILTPRWLEPMLSTHSSLRAPGIIGNVQRAVGTGKIDHTGFFVNSLGKMQQDVEWPTFFRRIKKVPAVTAACLLISRKLWHDLDGFDSQYRNGCEDIDLCFKALCRGLTNAVSLQSIVFHHISSAPGRRRHDEENTQKLTLRWRSLLSRLGTQARCRAFILRELNARVAYESPWASLQLGLQAAGFYRGPTKDGQRLIANAIDVETVRWARLPKQKPDGDRG